MLCILPVAGMMHFSNVFKNKEGNMKLHCLVSFVLIVFSSQALSGSFATTDDGKRIQLFEDGTWSRVEKSPTNKYRKILFADYFIDAKSMLGEPVKIKGVGGFSNRSGVARPNGKIYRKMFTIGPAISISTETLGRMNLAKVHECSLSCDLEISGIIKKGKYGKTIIEASVVRIVQ